MSNLEVLGTLDSATLEVILGESSTLAAFFKKQEKFNISSLPSDLLAYVLSFCHLSDVKQIALVCKTWTMLLKKPAFWKRHFFARIKSFTNDIEWHKRFENIFGLLVPSHPPSTSQDLLSDFAKTNFSWIFSKKQPQLEPTKDFLKLRSDVTLTLYYWFEPDGTCDQYGSFSEYSKARGRRCYTTNNWKYIYSECLPTSCQETNDPKAYAIWDNGKLRWEGETYKDLAFGEGVWSWPDGRTFSGKMVAYGGHPHGGGHDENGHPVEYIAGYRKDELEESFQRVKRRKVEVKNKIAL